MKKKVLKCQLFVHQHIQFESEVVSVRPVTVGERNSQWDVSLVCHKTGRETNTMADLVIITGVRESQPRIPDIGAQSVLAGGNIALGILISFLSRFGGFQCHSSQYRHPSQEEFLQKTVLIVGGGLSGVDLVVDIASTARRVLFSADRGMVLNHERKHLGENVVKDRHSKG